MALLKPDERIEYMCTYCGTKVIRAKSTGRPAPGKCARKPKNSAGQMRPHTWIINRKI